MAMSEDEIMRLKLLSEAETQEARITHLVEFVDDYSEELTDLCRTVHDAEADVHLSVDQRQMCSVALDLLVCIVAYHNAFLGSRPNPEL